MASSIENFNSKKTYLIFIAIIVTFCFLVFSQILSFSFISWDDNINIYNNELVINFSIHNFITNIDKADSHIWLTTFVWGTVYGIFGNNPMPFHAICLILHIFNCILVFFITILISKNQYISLMTALLFSVHPMHVESIAWASGGKDLLYSLFFLSSILVYINYLKTKKSWKFLIVILLAYLSSISKIQAVSLPILLILFDLQFKERIDLKNIIGKLLIGFAVLHRIDPAFKLLIVFVVLVIIEKYFHQINAKLNNLKTLVCIKRFFMKIIKYKKGIIILSGLFIVAIIVNYFVRNPLFYWDFKKNIFSFNFFEGLLMAGYSFNYYLLKFIFPFNLFAIHPYPDFVQPGIFTKYVINLIISIVIIIVIILAIFKINNMRKTIVFGFLFYLINISLVLHFVPIHGRLIVADRYVYLAFFGLCYLFSTILFKIFHTKKILYWSINVFILIVLGLQSHSYSKEWKNSFVLYCDVIKKNPEASFAYINRGNIYKESGKFTEAINDYSLAIKHYPKYSDAYYNRGLLLVDMEYYSDAIEDFNLAIENSKMADPEVITSRGWAKFLLNDVNGAIADFDAAIDIDSNYALPYNNRGWVKFIFGDVQGAISDINKALSNNPQMLEALNNRGWIKLSQNDLIGAIFDFEQAVELDSNFETGINNLAWAYFLNKDYNKSIKYYNKATEINKNNGKAYFYLGLSKLNINDTNGACSSFFAARNLGYTPAYEYLNKHCK